MSLIVDQIWCIKTFSTMRLLTEAPLLSETKPITWTCMRLLRTSMNRCTTYEPINRYYGKSKTKKSNDNIPTIFNTSSHICSTHFLHSHVRIVLGHEELRMRQENQSRHAELFVYVCMPSSVPLLLLDRTFVEKSKPICGVICLCLHAFVLLHLLKV